MIASFIAGLCVGAVTYIVLHIGLGIPSGWTIAACALVGLLMGLVRADLW